MNTNAERMDEAAAQLELIGPIRYARGEACRSLSWRMRRNNLFDVSYSAGIASTEYDRSENELMRRLSERQDMKVEIEITDEQIGKVLSDAASKCLHWQDGYRQGLVGAAAEMVADAVAEKVADAFKQIDIAGIVARVVMEKAMPAIESEAAKQVKEIAKKAVKTELSGGAK